MTAVEGIVKLIKDRADDEGLKVHNDPKTWDQ